MLGQCLPPSLASSRGTRAKYSFTERYVQKYIDMAKRQPGNDTQFLFADLMDCKGGVSDMKREMHLAPVRPRALGAILADRMRLLARVPQCCTGKGRHPALTLALFALSCLLSSARRIYLRQPATDAVEEIQRSQTLGACPLGCKRGVSAGTDQASTSALPIFKRI